MTQHSLISAIRLTVILVLLATAPEAAGAGKEFQHYTVELVDSSVSSAPLPLAPGQAVFATVWNHGEEAAPIRIEVVDAMTGESVGGAQTKSAPGVVSVMVLPLKASVAALCDVPGRGCSNSRQGKSQPASVGRFGKRRFAHWSLGPDV